MKQSKFTIACNWDTALLEGLKPYSDRIKHIYGKTRTDIFSGGRAASQVTELEERKRAEEYIQRAKELGLEFNYLLNGTYLPDEFSQQTTKRIRQDLDWISKTGAEWVTISNPRLAEIIKADYPNLNTNLSVFAHVRTPRQVERWQGRGVKSICLDRSLISDTKQIKALRKASDIDFTLLVNDPCLLNCEQELNHDTLMSRASASGEKYFHTCSFNCLRNFLDNPAEIISSTYIRPEDMELYELLGIDCFKIVDRNRSTKFILNAVEAYAKGRYNGNLMDLMSLFSACDRAPAQLTPLTAEELSEETIDKFWKALPSAVKLSIDNSKLNNYTIKRMSADCESRTCKDCSICPSKKSLVTYDNNAVETAKTNIDLIINTLNQRGL